MKKQAQQHGNVHTIINGKVYGTFAPAFRADMERRASAAGLTFDQFMVRKWRIDLTEMMAVI